MAVPPPLSAPDLTLHKHAMRLAMRRERREFSDRIDAPALAAQLGERLHDVIGDEGVLAGYVAAGGEPPVLTALERAAWAGRAVAIPHVGPDRIMTFTLWRPGTPLAPGPLGILQSGSPGDTVPDVVLVPLLAFDRAGRRLGQGAGCYDRWLAAHPRRVAIGIAWSVQEVPAVPVSPWDVALDAVVTEREVIRP